jgi:hypothetical protein
MGDEEVGKNRFLVEIRDLMEARSWKKLKLVLKMRLNDLKLMMGTRTLCN